MLHSIEAKMLSLGLLLGPLAVASAARADSARRYDVEPGQAMVNATLGTKAQISAVSLGLTGSLHESNGELRAQLQIPLASFASGRGSTDAKTLAALGASLTPILTFEGTAPPDKEGRTRFSGTLTLHGTTQQIEVSATLSRIGDRIYVHASFPISLGKFGVTVPGFGDLLHVDLDAGLRPVPEPLASRG